MKALMPQDLHAWHSTAPAKQIVALVAVLWVLWAYDFIKESEIDVGVNHRRDLFPTFHACQERAKVWERIAGEGIGLYCLPEDGTSPRHRSDRLGQVQRDM